MSTAAGLGLVSCHTCSLVSRAPETEEALCPRCGSRVHFRKPGSIGRTWAFLIAAMILYVPANTLPMMLTSSLFGSSDDTIISGVIFLWQDGSWYLALLVFVASILVPIAKMLALLVLLVSVQFGAGRLSAEQCSRLHRAIESIGRWSMLDIYVVALLATVVQLAALASVHAGPAAVAFGAVVVLTMLATESFDPRLIWDPVEEEHERPVERAEAA
ncbi:MAG TPA: paraquat-inducible protein A [Burkholderiales bacterium]|nr:paraquat-inducible protein A [Burkholderiales bacterium]